MKITFIGATHEVTGSCTLIEACGKKILVDIGMEQGPDIYENMAIPVSPEQIDAVFLTHAHIDHSGKLPALVKDGFQGTVYCTEATRKLCDIMLMDSAHIQEQEQEWQNKKNRRSGKELYEAAYTTKDVEKAMKLFSAFRYHDEIRLADGLTACFYNAGHLLGAANILFTIEENGATKTILFSGDIGNPGRPLLRDPETPPHADYVMIESTYADRLHEKTNEKTNGMEELSAVIRETLSRGGNVVIPSFAVGRTQDILYLIHEIKEKGLISDIGDFPVYMDSPLALKATGIYSMDVEEYLGDDIRELIHQGINPIEFSNLQYAETTEESKLINTDMTPKVIISASGMCEAGRIRHHLKYNLWRPESTIVFVGFQTEGTLGRRLLEGAKKVKLLGEEVVVRASIRNIPGFSGHADRNALDEWIRAVSPWKAFMNHGEDSVCDEFAERVRESGLCDAVAPFSGDCYDLATGEVIELQPAKRIATKKEIASEKVRSIFEKLLSAAQRLTDLVNGSRGKSNREIEEMTEKINELVSQYEKTPEDQ